MYRHTAPASTWQPPLPPSTGLWTLSLPINLWLKKTHANLACQARGTNEQSSDLSDQATTSCWRTQVQGWMETCGPALSLPNLPGNDPF